MRRPKGPRKPEEPWLQKFRESDVGESALDLVIIVVKSTLTVESQDIANMQLFINLAKKVKAIKIAYVVTKCDREERSENDKL